jgi:hypothetical protein
MILPLPSSPHWAPTKIVLAMSLNRYAIASGSEVRWTPKLSRNKNPRMFFRGKAHSLCAWKVETQLQTVNVQSMERRRSAGQ